MLGSLILYLKGMRIMMFQLSGFYYIPTPNKSKPQSSSGPVVFAEGCRVQDVSAEIFLSCEASGLPKLQALAASCSPKPKLPHRQP